MSVVVFLLQKWGETFHNLKQLNYNFIIISLSKKLIIILLSNFTWKKSRYQKSRVFCYLFFSETFFCRIFDNCLQLNKTKTVWKTGAQTAVPPDVQFQTSGGVKCESVTK